MGYQLRMHHEIRDWLTGLRDSEPVLARFVGEAVLALIDAGEALGPPLVIPLESVLRQPEDPREALDLSYQRQLEILTKVRRGVADVATSRKRVEEQLAVLQRQYRVLTGEEERLTLASQRLQAKVEAFRMRKESLKASYTAAEASIAVGRAMAELRAETGEPEETSAEDASPVSVQEPAPAADLLREIRDTGPDDPGPVVPPPPGTMVLLPGAPDYRRAGLLFVVAPQDTAVLLAYVTDPGQSVEDYQAAARAAADRLPASPAVAEHPRGGSPAGGPAGALGRHGA